MLTDLIPFRGRGTSAMADPFSNLRHTMDRMLAEFGKDFETLPNTLPASASSFYPRLDYEDRDDAIVLSAELPGLTDKDITVEVNKDVLTMKGEKKSCREEKGSGFYRGERLFGAFERTLRLPYEIEKDKVTAAMKDGVLTVTLPKCAEAKKEIKRIPVQH